METLLCLYAMPYDPRFPVVCFDERPCFLLGDVVEGLAAPQPAQPSKQHYAYTKPGSCCVLAAVEPLTGQRLYQVRSRRTKREYTQFMQRLAARYPQAEKIRLVQDNLNTHAPSTFYDCLPAALAERLALASRTTTRPNVARGSIKSNSTSRRCHANALTGGFPARPNSPTRSTAGAKSASSKPSKSAGSLPQTKPGKP